jgi:hypothetical protein
MSLSRNPWHIREYYPQELKDLLLVNFSDVETLGVFGGPKAMEYYEKNKKSVNRIMRFDIFKMQYWLPRWILRVPYDLMNRRNRNKLLEKNQDLTSDLTTSDFYIQEVNEQSLDLYYISTK